MMDEELNVKKATLDELCEQALEHYNNLSLECSDFNSLIPKAIEFYKKKEHIRQKIIKKVINELFGEINVKETEDND